MDKRMSEAEDMLDEAAQAWLEVRQQAALAQARHTVLASKMDLQQAVSHWRSIEKVGSLQAAVAATEAAAVDKARFTGMKQLRLTLARMIRGELGMRLVVWRIAMRESQAQRLESIETAMLESLDVRANALVLAQQLQDQRVRSEADRRASDANREQATEDMLDEAAQAWLEVRQHAALAQAKHAVLASRLGLQQAINHWRSNWLQHTIQRLGEQDREVAGDMERQSLTALNQARELYGELSIQIKIGAVAPLRLVLRAVFQCQLASTVHTWQLSVWREKSPRKKPEKLEKQCRELEDALEAAMHALEALEAGAAGNNAEWQQKHNATLMHCGELEKMVTQARRQLSQERQQRTDADSEIAKAKQELINSRACEDMLRLDAEAAALRQLERVGSLQALVAEMKAAAAGKARLIGIKQLRLALARMIGSDFGVLLAVWRIAMWESQRLDEQRTVGVETEAFVEWEEACILSPMSRLMNQTPMKMTDQAEAAVDKARLAGLKMLRLTLARMIGSDFGVLLAVWRIAMWESQGLDEQRTVGVETEAFAEWEEAEKLEKQCRELEDILSPMSRLMNQTPMTMTDRAEAAADKIMELEQQLQDERARSSVDRATVEARIVAKDATIVDLSTKAVDKARLVGMKQLRLTLARMVRGELGMRLVVWRIAMRASQGLDAQQVALTETKVAAVDKARLAGLKMLRLTLARMMGSELTILLAEWRIAMWKSQGLDEQQTVGDETGAFVEWGEGMKQLRVTLARMVRGELGMRLTEWRIAMRESQWQGQMAALEKQLPEEGSVDVREKVSELEQQLQDERARSSVDRATVEARIVAKDATIVEISTKAVDKARLAGMKQLRLTLARMVRGELGMRLAVWRFAMRASQGLDAQQVAVTETKVAAVDKARLAGLKQLRLTLARMVRGELGMRLVVWRIAMRASQGLDAQQVAVTETKVAAVDKARLVGMKQLRLTLARMVRGELGMRLTEWRIAMRESQWQGQMAALEKQLPEEGSVDVRAKVSALEQQLQEERARSSVDRATVEARIVAKDATIVDLSTKLESSLQNLEADREAQKAVELAGINNLQAQKALQLADQALQLAGIKMLRLMLARMIRGELGMRLVMWQIALNESLAQSVTPPRVGELEATTRRRKSLPSRWDPPHTIARPPDGLARTRLVTPKQASTSKLHRVRLQLYNNNAGNS